MNDIQNNILKIKERIAKSALKSGKNPEKITLVAVTKKVSIDKIKSAIDYGLTNFGENYWQEAREKISALNNKNVKWHFIGHLQKNKVNSATEVFDLIQSVDNLELLEKINKRAKEISKIQNVLLQINPVRKDGTLKPTFSRNKDRDLCSSSPLMAGLSNGVNIAEEIQKFGASADNVISILKKSIDFKNVLIKGLMLIPPFLENSEENRMNFKKLKELSLKIDEYKFPHWENKYLSMGMTDDFETAIQEGSNMVRIGRAIFGERN